ncbi:magnesium transporter [Sanguibacter sp. HDW7]|uniref:magnesium transporter n=1 Tax=Sanguibacter sp. HDW7 TaxID=2714931 RepID=UPI00140BE062|nr:magnesium transporter [Sanguibacter sp. HDW7]QIK82778.1 magnesium transporter [Sanguibacter sp. HDW7]
MRTESFIPSTTLVSPATTADPAEVTTRAETALLDLLADPGTRVGVVGPDGSRTDVLVADLRAAMSVAADAEATEDADRQGGSSPLDVPYLEASPWLLWRRRVGWLAVLFVAEMCTGSVLRHFEDELATVVALTFFIPLLIGTGGNTGTQVTTTLVRAMALGEVRARHVLAVVRKEMTTGVLLAACIAGLAWVRALVLGVGGEVALTVSVAIVLIVLWSVLLASTLPFVLRRFGVDPAVVSGPLITTLVDGTGLVIYLSVASVLVTQLGG